MKLLYSMFDSFLIESASSFQSNLSLISSFIFSLNVIHFFAFLHLGLYLVLSTWTKFVSSSILLLLASAEIKLLAISFASCVTFLKLYLSCLLHVSFPNSLLLRFSFNVRWSDLAMGSAVQIIFLKIAFAIKFSFNYCNCNKMSTNS